MPLQAETKTDFRIYIGIVLFRWQTIVLCFLVSLLCAVVFLNSVPRRYRTMCKIMVHKDENLEAPSPTSPWSPLASHIYLLSSSQLRTRASENLRPEWETVMGGFDNMTLDVSVSQVPNVRYSLQITADCENQQYGEAFVSNLVAVHQEEWLKIQSKGTDKAMEALEKELVRLEGRIREAEEEVSEYKRIHDLIRQTAKSSMEVRYLEALIAQKSSYQTELMLMEAQSPMLKDENAAVISDVLEMTQETGATKPVAPEPEYTLAPDGRVSETQESADARASDLPLPDQIGGDRTGVKGPNIRSQEVIAGLMELRVQLGNLRAKEKELSEKFKPEHPELLATRKEISQVEAQLNVAAQVQIARVQDRYKALKIQLDALERAEYSWKARTVLATERQSELKRIEAKVDRYERNYSSLYEKLQALKVNEELQADRFYFLEPIGTDPTPVWPKAAQILIVALAAGLGVGFGLVILAHFFDNRVQTIRDVESELGVPFLGGVPFWADSGLEDSVRPIVTERDSIGAVEAYRSVRTSVLSALNKRHSKLALITSADSKEGKTLTALNLAVTTAQMERKVLLVDMDLRRGRLHKSLGVDKAPGFTEVLKGTATIDSVVRQTRIKNLDFIAAGESVENGAELLHAVDLRALMKGLTLRYDYVLVDTSPVLRVTDTVIAANEMGAEVLFVAHVNRTPKPMIRYALSLLKDVDIAGIVMNGIEMHRISSLYYAYQYPNYAYYSNAYRYGYDYAYGDQQPGQRPRPTRRKNFSQWRHDLGEKMKRTFLPFEGGR